MNKKVISWILIVVLALAVQSVGYAANCRTPSSASISLNKSGQHSATARVSGITQCTGMSNYENSVTVRITVKVGVRPGDSVKWYAETSATKSNVGSASKTQTVTPVVHYLIGAKGSWSATCRVCGRSNQGNIAYKN